MDLSVEGMYDITAGIGSSRYCELGHIIRNFDWWGGTWSGAFGRTGAAPVLVDDGLRYGERDSVSFSGSESFVL